MYQEKQGMNCEPNSSKREGEKRTRKGDRFIFGIKMGNW